MDMGVIMGVLVICMIVTLLVRVIIVVFVARIAMMVCTSWTVDVSGRVAMSMASPGESPDQEAKPCQREYHTDDMSLLHLQVVLKLETDERNDTSEHQR